MKNVSMSAAGITNFRLYKTADYDQTHKQDVCENSGVPVLDRGSFRSR